MQMGFSHCCQGNHKISQSQVRIHIAWFVGEGGVLGYILLIFVVICVYFACYNFIFDFSAWFTLLRHDRKCSKFVYKFPI